jgi:signal transduction histidine kinase
MGLAVVLETILLHGWHVWAESRPGAEAIMSFTLPSTT